MVLAESGKDQLGPLAIVLIPAAASLVGAAIGAAVTHYNAVKDREQAQQRDGQNDALKLQLREMELANEKSIRDAELASAERMKALELKAQKEKDIADREFEAKEREKDREHELKKLALGEKSKESSEDKQPGERKVVDEKIEKDGESLEKERSEQVVIRKNSTSKTLAKDGGQFLTDYVETEENKNPINLRVDPNYNSTIIEKLKNDSSCLEAMQDLTKIGTTQYESIKKVQSFRSKIIRFDNKKDQIKRLEKINTERTKTCSNRTYAGGL